MHLINSLLVYHVSLVNPWGDGYLPGSLNAVAFTPVLGENRTLLSPRSTAGRLPFMASTARPPLLFAFLDVPQGYWARDFISPLVERGILRGFPDGTFRPNQVMTRAEFAVLLTQFPWSDWLGEADPPNPIAPFRDVDPDYWAAMAIAQVAQWGLMTGDPNGRFRPQASLSRLEALLTLSKGLQDLPPPNLDILNAYHDRFVIPASAQETIALATQQQLVVTYPDPHFLNPNRLATRAEVCAFLHQLLSDRGELPPIQSPYINLRRDGRV